MHTINASNVNDAYVQAITHMRHIMRGAPAQQSRAGDVIESQVPVTTVYGRPWQCVLWDARRDANPFFHLFESLWMLAGRRDIGFLSKFSSAIGAFVDDGTGEQHGAYGYRWRQWFGFDQLDALVAHLKADPMSRRAVLQMWDPEGDLCKRIPMTQDWQPAAGKDLPCNTSVYFSLRSGELTMMVSNRSNDIILGCYGANAVHFSILQQYMAFRLGVPAGQYTQVSFNWHTYTKTWDDKIGEIWYPSHDQYKLGVQHLPWDIPDAELLTFMNNPQFNHGAYQSSFLTNVVIPMWDAWALWKKDRMAAIDFIKTAEKLGPAVDWLVACRMWMERRVSHA